MIWEHHKGPPDYSSGFKRMTGFRHTSIGVGPGGLKSGGNAGGLSSKRSPIHPIPPGPKRPRPGK